MIKRDTVKRLVLSVLGYKVNNCFLVSGEGFLPKNFRLAVEKMESKIDTYKSPYSADQKEIEFRYCTIPIVDKKNRYRGYLVKDDSGRVKVYQDNNVGSWDITE
jgi:hypothetical protein